METERECVWCQCAPSLSLFLSLRDFFSSRVIASENYREGQKKRSTIGNIQIREILDTDFAQAFVSRDRVVFLEIV